MNWIKSRANQISIIRILLIPVFLIFLLSNIAYREYIAALFFIILSLSDALDGYVARKRKEVTSFGKIIDPVADKLLIAAALVFLVGRGVDLWMAIAIISREVIITTIRLIALVRGIVISASYLGKVKTFSQILAIILVILNIPGNWWFMLIAVIVTLLSGIDYLIKALKHVKEKIFNIPNMITFLRLLLIPIYLILLFDGSLNKALLIFIVIGVTDKLDGMFARLTNQTTKFGKVFDSLTDWTLILVSFISFTILGILHFSWLITIIIPSLVDGIVKLQSFKQDQDFMLTPVAQIAVGFTYLTVAAVLLNFFYMNLMLIVMVALLYLAMFMYLYLNFKKGPKLKFKI